MGLQAIGTILDPLLRIGKAAAAPVAQRVQRAIAKQAAEALRICVPVAGVILAFFILKKIVMGHSDFPFSAAFYLGNS